MVFAPFLCCHSNHVFYFSSMGSLLVGNRSTSEEHTMDAVQNSDSTASVAAGPSPFEADAFREDTDEEQSFIDLSQDSDSSIGGSSYSSNSCPPGKNEK